MSRTPPAAGPCLIPHGGAAPTAEVLELWLAVRLHARHRAEPVRTLEALAAALANRLRHAGIRGGPAPAALPGDPAFAVCRRIARRALAGPAASAVAGATRYHHRAVEPAWARSAVPRAAVGGFLFYGNEEKAR